jgi:hypothetical protein
MGRATLRTSHVVGVKSILEPDDAWAPRDDPRTTSGANTSATIAAVSRRSVRQRLRDANVRVDVC